MQRRFSFFLLPVPSQNVTSRSATKGSDDCGKNLPAPQKTNGKAPIFDRKSPSSHGLFFHCHVSFSGEPYLFLFWDW